MKYSVLCVRVCLLIIIIQLNINNKQIMNIIHVYKIKVCACKVYSIILCGKYKTYGINFKKRIRELTWQNREY